MALTSPRNTAMLGQGGVPQLVTYPVAASTIIYTGSIVCLNADGDAVPGNTTTGVVTVGIAGETVDNSTGLAGALNITIRQGVFNLTNQDGLTKSAIGGLVYVYDDSSVSALGTIAAGPVYGVDASGIWVYLGIGNTQAGPQQLIGGGNESQSVVSVPIPAYSALVNDAVILRLTPGYAGRILAMRVQDTAAVTGTGNAATLTPKIAGTSVTGGVVTITSAGQNTIGAVQNGTTVTGANTFTANQEITVVVSDAGGPATGSITAVAKANLVDGETFTILPDDSGGIYEFDVTGNGVAGGHYAVDVSGATTADDVATIIAAAIQNTYDHGSGDMAASATGSVVTLTGHSNYGGFAAENVAITTTVADSGFAVTGMSGGIDPFNDGAGVIYLVLG